MSTPRTLAVLARAACLVLAACNGDKQETDSGPATDTDSDDTDAVDTDDTDAPAREGLLQRVGTATVTDSYAGTEDLQLVSEEDADGDGEDDVVCRIRYELVSVAVRDDCVMCEWAFDLEIRGATVAEDPLGVCLAVTGYDASNVAELDGTISARGFDPEYAGHAEVLLSELEPGSWQTVSYATFVGEQLDYAWDDGYVAY